MARIFISLTTIPPRILHPLFYQHLLHLQKQTIPVDTIFLTIPKTYQRFNLDSQCIDILNDIQSKISNLKIIWIEKDYGPSCKFLGPLLHHWDTLENQILILIDDDRFYDIKMSELYQNFFNTHSNILVSTGNQNLYFHQHSYLNWKDLEYRINPHHYVAAFMSCAFFLKHPFHKLANYTLEILQFIPSSFYHDEGILLNFIKFYRLIVYIINYPFINIIQQEMPFSLVEGNYVNRRYIENEIRIQTNKSNLLPHCSKLSKLNFFKFRH